MNKSKFIKIIFALIFICFVVVYAIEESGYYEYELANKKNLTEQEIEKFESDVANGEYIDLKEYNVDKEVSYSNKFTNLVSDTSLLINKYLKKGIESIFGLINKLIEE